MSKIRVAVAGVGNCCSALVQGVSFLRHSVSSRRRILLPNLGGYRPTDIEFVAAFDVDSRKVGRDLADSIFAEPNSAPRFSGVRDTGVQVTNVPPMDGLAESVKDHVHVASSKRKEPWKVLKEADADMLINLVPTGADRASGLYASASIRAGCAFVNATPSRIASTRLWQERYRRSKLPLVGDDLIDQVGATVLHRAVLRTLVDRGLLIDESYQLDIGGGMESLIALDRRRYETKRRIKKNAVGSVVPYEFPLVSGSSDYVDFMRNSRTSYFWIKGKCFGDIPFAVDITLNIVDAPAGAGSLIDVIRAVKIAIDREIAGPLVSVGAYSFKLPPKKVPYEMALIYFKQFLNGIRDS